MLLDLETLDWTAISQQGFIPQPRWGAALAYNSRDQSIYIFGGSNHREGACGNEIHVFEMRPQLIE